MGLTGLRADHIINLAQNIDKLIQAQESFHRQSQLSLIEELGKSSDDKIKEISAMMGDYLKLLESLSFMHTIFSSIHDVAVDKVSYLADASVILARLKPITDESRYFRVVVNLLVLKFKLKYNYYFQKTKISSCEQVDQLMDKLDEFNFELMNIAKDLEVLYPDNKEFSEVTDLDVIKNINDLTSFWKQNKQTSLNLIVSVFNWLNNDKTKNLKEDLTCP